MTENVQSAMLEILKRIQSDVADVKHRLGGVEGRIGGLEGRMGGVEGRLDRIEDIVAKQRRDSAAMLVMMRATVGAFDERLLRVEGDIGLIKDAMG
jgi:hypothetical protein